ncbi:MAG: hypothetical protein K2Z80_15385 [Xanthobacteraceae bacterium]|nr:hypothetical protein [Xanthobacteraceae bacterium]
MEFSPAQLGAHAHAWVSRDAATLDRPPEPVIGPAKGRTRWRAMTAGVSGEQEVVLAQVRQGGVLQRHGVRRIERDPHVAADLGASCKMSSPVFKRQSWIVPLPEPTPNR